MSDQHATIPADYIETCAPGRARVIQVERYHHDGTCLVLAEWQGLRHLTSVPKGDVTVRPVAGRFVR